MSDVGANTHDFFAADLAIKGWLPGISWGIQAAGGNRQTNEARISGTPSYTGQIRESRSILDSPSGPSGPMMPGAAGVKGSMKIPVAPSGPGQTGVYTPEEETLGRFFGMARRGKNSDDSNSLAGKASGGRGRAGGPASNTDNVYSAGRDNIVGSSYAAGVSGNAAVNQGTNYGVMGGENNRVNQLFFKTGDNSPMAVGAQPTATSGSGKPASGTGRTRSVTKRRSAGGTTATPAATSATGGTAKGGKTPAATPAATPTASTPAATPTAATPAQTRPNLKTGNTGATPTVDPTNSSTPAAPPTSGAPGARFPLTPMAGTPAVTGSTSAGSSSTSTSSESEIPEFLLRAKEKYQASTPASSGTISRVEDPFKDIPDAPLQPIPEWFTADTSLAAEKRRLELGIPSPLDHPSTVSFTAQTPVQTPVQTTGAVQTPAKTTGATVDNQAIDPLIRYGVGSTSGPYTSTFPAIMSGSSRGPGIRERFSAILGNRRRGPQQPTADVAPPDGMTRPTEAWPGGALGGGSGVRRDGSFSVGDPLMDAAYAREQSGEPAPEGPYTDTFKKIKLGASRAQRRARGA